MTVDVLLFETGSGGSVLLRNNDVVTVAGYENMPYIAQFGGNGYWADDLVLTGNQRHTSQTEQVMNSVPLNSAGRIAIEDAITADLSFFSDAVPGTDAEVSVSIAAKDRVDADIEINGQNIYMNFNPDSMFLTYALT